MNQMIHFQMRCAVCNETKTAFLFWKGALQKGQRRDAGRLGRAPGVPRASRTEPRAAGAPRRRRASRAEGAFETVRATHFF